MAVKSQLGETGGCWIIFAEKIIFRDILEAKLSLATFNLTQATDKSPDSPLNITAVTILFSQGCCIDEADIVYQVYSLLKRVRQILDDIEIKGLENFPNWIKEQLEKAIA